MCKCQGDLEYALTKPFNPVELLLAVKTKGIYRETPTIMLLFFFSLFVVKYQKNVIYELPVCYLKISKFLNENLTNLNSSTYVINVKNLCSRFAGYTVGTGGVRYLHF